MPAVPVGDLSPRYAKLPTRGRGVRIIGFKRPEVGSVVTVGTVKETIVSARVESLRDQVVWICEIAPKPKATRKPVPRKHAHCTDCGGSTWDGAVCSWTGMRHGGRG